MRSQRRWCGRRSPHTRSVHFEDIASLQRGGCGDSHRLQAKPFGGGRGGSRLTATGCRAGAADHDQVIEDDQRILDEDPVRVRVCRLDLNDRPPARSERLNVLFPLPDGRADRRAHAPRASTPHGPDRERAKRTSSRDTDRTYLDRCARRSREAPRRRSHAERTRRHERMYVWLWGGQQVDEWTCRIPGRSGTASRDRRVTRRSGSWTTVRSGP